MADYFRVLALHAASNRLAIVDPADSRSSPPRPYTYAELLLRVSLFHERLVAAATGTGRELNGARIGKLVSVDM